MTAAVKDAVLHESAVLVVALRDLDQVAGSLLRSVTRQGVKLLVLIDDDLTNLSRLAGVRSSGFASISDLNANRLHVALQRLRGGEMPIPPHVAQFLVSLATEQYDAGTSRTRVRLTPREQEALVLLVDGLSNKQIARRLGISAHGAKRHVANVLAKLDCSNRTLAVARALREGLYEEYLELGCERR
ncbi:MAG: helix-turn-helix domain-containing protein [Pseudonocardiaceae bacterium]